MKSHFVRILFRDVFGKDYLFQGRVTGKELPNGKVVISPSKLFFNVFGFPLPDYVTFSWG